MVFILLSKDKLKIIFIKIIGINEVIICAEIFLAIIYFLTVLIVNYFLFNLVNHYRKIFFFLVKLEKNIFPTKKIKKITIIPFLYLYFKSSYKELNIFFSEKNDLIDVLILGNSYHYFNFFKIKKNFKNFSYYFSLLETQNLPSSFSD